MEKGNAASLGTRPEFHKTGLHADVIEAYSRVLAAPRSDYVEGFPSALDAFREWSRKFPNRYEHEFFRSKAPDWLELNERLISALANDAYSWAGFVLTVNVYRMEELTELLIRSLNERSGLSATLAARGLLENAAVFSRGATRLSIKVAKLGEVSKPGKHMLPYVVVAKQKQRKEAACDLLKEARLMATKTRFDWQAILDGQVPSESDAVIPAEMKSGNVLNAIDKMKLEGDHPEGFTARVYYSMLCDFLHPNAGSVTSFMETATPIGSGKHRFVVSRSPNNTDLTDHILQVVAVPVRESLNQFLRKADEVRLEVRKLRKALEQQG